MAETFLIALVNAERVFKAHRATLGDNVSPVQLWPHGFDLAFEWYGSQTVVYEEGGQTIESPAQLNLGFFPGGPETDPYFYSNPWPFDGQALLGQPLPRGASWHTQGWQGTILPYGELAGDPDAEARLLAYARRVYERCAPALMAE